MRLPWLAVLVACGGGDEGPPLTVSTTFLVTDAAGAGMSPLDPLYNQVIDIEIEWTLVDHRNGDAADTAGCKTRTFGFTPSRRTASGATTGLVRTEILNRLADWDVRFQACDPGAGRSSISLEAVINELNLLFGCFGLPASAVRKDADGLPMLTTFTATECSATILDVVNNRLLSNPSFSIRFETGPAQLP